MIVYAESSAVLAWLFAEEQAEDVAAILESATHVVVSDLLFVECDRALIRVSTLGGIDDEQLSALRQHLVEVAKHWETQRISAAVLDRSRQAFPREPVRTLDALHLATALRTRALLPEIRLVSLDERIRDNAAKLGFEVMPAAES